jgi:hypothetical protein
MLLAWVQIYRRKSPIPLMRHPRKIGVLVMVSKHALASGITFAAVQPPQAKTIPILLKVTMQNCATTWLGWRANPDAFHVIHILYKAH